MISSLSFPGSRSLWLIMGLGNPGRKYADTRHNIGFRVLDRLSVEMGIPLDRLKHQAQMGQGQYRQTSLILAKPMTFMNLSGESVRQLASYNNIDSRQLIVLHDEVDFLLGTLRIKTGGGAGGHKGIQSVIDCLGESDFTRLRIGVGRPREGNLADYVLSRFEDSEKEQLEVVTQKAVAVLLSIFELGIDEARKRLHAGEQ